MKTQIRHLANGEKRTVRKADDPKYRGGSRGDKPLGDSTPEEKQVKAGQNENLQENRKAAAAAAVVV